MEKIELNILKAVFTDMKLIIKLCDAAEHC